MTTEKTIACVSDLVLDRLFVGELDDASRARIELHVSDCSYCRERWDQRHRDSELFSSQVAIADVVDRTQRDLRVRARKRWAVGASFVAAAAAVLVIVVLPSRPHELAPTVRAKGGLALELIAQTQDGDVEHLVSPASLLPGESIRFALTTPTSGYATILGIDSAGVVTPYVPLQGDPIHLAANQRKLIDGSIILDDTLGHERIFAIVCDNPDAVAKLVSIARTALSAANGRPDRMEQLGSGCAETSFLIDKVSSR